MIRSAQFNWNPFRENGYVLYDQTGECLIMDPGCYEQGEQDLLVSFIRKEKLKPVALINTHCHIDHVLGNHFVFQQYGLLPQFNFLELGILHAIPSYAAGMGLRYELSPEPVHFIDEGDFISFGESSLTAILTPGHSPGSLSFYSKADDLLISGDALFYESIGRTDLPGGNLEMLVSSIKSKLFTLDPQTRVWPGHGKDTTIGHEIEFNPYLQA